MQSGGGILPSCAAVIVDYDSGPALAACVRSLQGQVDTIVVVDNASREPARSRLAAGGVDPASLVLIRNPENRGFAAACNQGLVAVPSEVVLFVNPDCVLPAGAVARLCATLKSDPTIGMVGPRLLGPDGQEQWGGRREFPGVLAGLRRLAGRRPSAQPGGETVSSPIDVPAISGACMAVRREACAAVGVWDEGFFLHCEDLDWCRRFGLAGWRVVFDPAVSVYHDKGTCSRSRPCFVEWHKHRGMWRFYRKYEGRSAWGRVFAPVVALGIAAHFVVACVRLSIRSS